MYQLKNFKVNHDIEAIMSKIRKVDYDLNCKVVPQYNSINPTYQEYKTMYEEHKQKLDILIETKAMLKKTAFRK